MLIPAVQNKVGNIITNQLSNDLGTDVSVGSIRFYPIKKIVINDLLVKDQKSDSLLFIEQISAPIDSIVFAQNHIYLGAISVKSLKTSILIDEDRNNFSFIVDSLSNKTPSKSKWKYNFNEIIIKNSSVGFQNLSKTEAVTRFNPNNINVSSLNLHIDRFQTRDNFSSLRIRNFSFQEESGLNIKKSKGFIRFGKNGLYLSNLTLSTTSSYLSIGKLNLSYDSTFTNTDFINKAALDLQINSLSADANELVLFIPDFPKLRHRINLRGNFNGTVADLKGRNISVNAGLNTELETTFDIKGLPNIRDTYVYLNIKKLSTDIEDLSKIFAYNRGSESIELPDSFNNLGNIEFNGIFNGFVDNLVAYGKFSTNIGVINTDIGIKLTEENKLIYSGFVNTESFNVGKIIGSEENLNNVTMDVSVQGYKEGKDHFNSYIQGSIDSIDFKGYKYQKLELNGLLSNKRFDGKLELNDPNAKLSFNGKLDFSGSVPEFDFSASISDVRLNKLNLAPHYEESLFKLKLNASASGHSLNSISGTTIFHSGKFIADDRTFQLDSLIIEANQNGDYKEIVINSDILDAELVGNYKLKTISNTFQQILAKSLPSLFTEKDYVNHKDQFTFNLKTKNTAQLFEVINSELTIADGSEIHGEINGVHNQMQITSYFDQVGYKDIFGEELNANITSVDNKVTTDIKSKLIAVGNIIPLNNFSIHQEGINDSIKLDIDWNNYPLSGNRGEISTMSRIKKSKNGDTYTKIQILPSYFAIGDSIWNIQESDINITPDGFRVNTFRVHHMNQEINVNGSLYKEKEGTLTSYLQNIDLAETTSLFNIKRLTFDGLLNGNFQLSNTLKKPIITSNITLDNFKVNDKEVGNVFVESNWSNLQKAVLINTKIERGDIQPLNGIGYFKPENSDFNFTLKLDSLPLGFLNMYTSHILQNFNGTGSGDLELTKTEYGIGLNGAVKVNQAKFDVDLLQCSFFVEDSVKFTPDAIIFDNMKVTDTKGGVGEFKGSITHKNFSKMAFDLYIGANNMLLMNTKPKDNPVYYGTVFATGDLAINGSIFDMNVNINGVTERNTSFYIPISEDGESLNNNFIQFYNINDTLASVADQDKEGYKVKLSNYNLSLGVDITPDAEVQVIFDPVLGNILTSSGKGSLQINRNKEGEISFIGSYTAEKGDYLFSLQNVVNKKFDINNGGTVVWEGDPYDATIDITATYKLKASLQPLSMDQVSNELSRRVPINCDLILSKRLSQPNINFGITAPTLEQSTQSIIEQAISTEEELNRQVLSLLVLNKFTTPSYNDNGGNLNSTTLANAYTSELLSSQLSNFVSQMLDDVDVGISYRPEDEISSEQIEVALSTQMFNDRVTLNTNVEYGNDNKANTNKTNSSSIVGDFDVNVKLNQSGSLRAKAYSHSNDDFSFDNSPTTQGVGLSYQEEFNTVAELFHKYWNFFTGKGKKEKEPIIEPDKQDLLEEKEESISE
ncbi:translocation/assembly module TamB domain-containing protein [Labilibacter marinus]|uniref:translocation/assembly module TamB domain-containing protein n=1 Tax=Labilibacter marinus TaxID=1477105 RepID=UPI00117A5A6A|nr:translocation/assembly module TamB domain-containing protein [Labilibacter marinus]